MKKLIPPQSGIGVCSNLYKLLIVMKLTAILLIVVCLQASATGFAQNEVSLSVKNIELKKNYLFSCNKNKLPVFVWRWAASQKLPGWM